MKPKTRLKWRRERGADYLDYWTSLRTSPALSFDMTIEIDVISRKRVRIHRLIWMSDMDRPLFEDVKTVPGTLDYIEQELRGLEWNILAELRALLVVAGDKVSDILHDRNTDRP